MPPTLPYPADRCTVPVLGSPIDALDWTEALERIDRWAAERSSRYVCICNVHSVVTATQDERFAQVLREADTCTPDGAPVAWMLRRQGHGRQRRINGPDLMWQYCGLAEQRGRAVYLLGSTVGTLSALETRLRASFPGLRIAGSYSPPFRALSPQEDADLVQRVNESGAGVVFVSLGCPKQELWMAAHRGLIRGVMIGVGAAFDYHAGTLPRAPRWMQDHGLEWLHRLAHEPRRLWKRYAVTNSLFVMKASWQLLRGGRS